MEEIKEGNKKNQFLFDHFDRGGWRKWTKETGISHRRNRRKESYFKLS